MSKTKLALSMIVRGNKEEAVMLDRCLKSVVPFVDGVFITLTNPDKSKLKETRAVCKKHKVVTSYFKWVEDFAKARNFAMAKIPKEYGWFIWLDADDVLRSGDNLKKAVARAEAEKADAVFFNYLYQVELDEKGNIKQVLIEHLRERLLRNTGIYKWVAPIHETLIEQKPTKKIDLPDCDVVHLSGDERRGKALHRNIKILKRHIKETKKKDPRPIYYLAKAYYDLHLPKYYQKAEPMLYQYLATSGWAEERSQAWEYLCEIYRTWGQHNKSIKCCWNALQEWPQFPSIYFNLAISYMIKNDWDKALFWVKLGSKLPQPKSTLVTNPRDLAARALNVIYNCSIKKSMLDEAHAATVKLKEMFPEDKNVDNQLKFTNHLRQTREVTKLIVELSSYLEKTGEKDKLKPLLASVPKTIQNNPFIVNLQKKIYPPRKHKVNEIAIFCGPGWTNWSPAKITKPGKSFLGGSEEAVVYLSTELARLGWDVTVYGDPGEDEGYHGGVNWLPYYKFNRSDEFNILIGWRNVKFVDGNFKAKKTYIWCHDVLNPLDHTDERMKKVTKLIVLSPAHRKTVPGIPDSKIFVSSNGFCEHFPDLKPNNDPHKLIWTSSYDRGLRHLLNMWAEVKEAVPKAELHIFYGWQLFDKFYRDNPERMAWRAKMEELMKQPGITHHGRVPQPEVEEWHKKCGIWAYPTHFYEINCISAIKAQLWGNVPICTDYAALDTTVKYGTKIEGEIYSAEVKKKFIKALIKALKDHQWQDEQRKLMEPWARETFSWRKIAKAWTQEFKGKALDEAVKVLLKHDDKLAKYLPVQLQQKNGLKESY